MSKNVDLIKAFQKKGTELFQSNADAKEVLGEYLTEDFECVEPPQMPVGGVFRGWDAISTIIEIYARHFNIECLNMEFMGSDESNVVAAKGTWRFIAKETGRSIVAPAVELFTIENGKVKSIEVFQFDAAGIVATL